MLLVLRGVGLLRSEFLFLNRTDIPSEEEQFMAYRAVVESTWRPFL